jgi:hypothetical protein
MKNTLRLACGLAVALTLAVTTAHSQSISLSGGSPVYTSDFDIMGSAGTAPPTGWFVGTSLSPTTTGTNGTFTAGAVVVDNGGSNAGANRNYGTTAAADRALGSIASGTGNTRVTEARFINSTGLTITNIDISFFGEQWRTGGSNQLVNTLPLFFGTDGTNFTATGISFSTPIFGVNSGGTATGGGNSLDGNLAANRASVSGSIASLSIADGTVFYLRWVDINEVGNDAGVAIDDLTLTAFTIPEPSTMLLVGAGLVGLLALRRRHS